ncbi:hypothetical protein CO615_04675 [Lysobacteraceae bacterium NML75-0749]|nr:hypothetical protein CO615_04675 [Xanthomonadaceae bacterium NML75-0749]
MKNPPVTASPAARELIAANRARKMRQSTVSPAQREHIKRMNARTMAHSEREKKRKAQRPAANNAPPQTVEAWLAQGGKIERLPDHASGIKLLRYDYSSGTPRKIRQHKQGRSSPKRGST